MTDPLMEESLRQLCPHLWHTTRADRYRAIIDTGAILPEPDIPDRERYGTALGASGYPFARSLGGVSLFDFHSFDAEDYSARFRMSSWQVFVPYHRDWGDSVWIELDRGVVSNELISPPMLLERWKAEAPFRRIMPLIEAAHIGPVPLSAFRQILSISATGITRLA